MAVAFFVWRFGWLCFSCVSGSDLCLSNAHVYLFLGWLSLQFLRLLCLVCVLRGQFYLVRVGQVWVLAMWFYKYVFDVLWVLLCVFGRYCF